ncbi:MAG: hypothetical protein QW559_00760 [Candidatus Woesearchaeota archaeon]
MGSIYYSTFPVVRTYFFQPVFGYIPRSNQNYHIQFPDIRGYEHESHLSDYNFSLSHKSLSHFFVAENFLLKNRPTSPFVSELSEIFEYIRKTFKLMMKKEFPGNIAIELCEPEEFSRMNNAAGIVEGFSLNEERGISRVFVKKGHLDKVMLTVGHEIGHVLTKSLQNPIDEEAKAYAFSFGWMKTIYENDVAGLSKSIAPFLSRPAQNGIHDVAFNFVSEQLSKGVSPLALFYQFASGSISVPRPLEQIVLLQQ